MAIVRCNECGSQVNESEYTCPYCGNSIKTKLQCPKCGSSAIDLEAKIKEVGGFGETFLRYTFGFFVGNLLKESIDGKTTVKYVCKNCGKKFKLK